MAAWVPPGQGGYVDPVPLEAAARAGSAGGSGAAVPDRFVQHRIALAFTDADRTRMLDFLGAGRVATIAADFRPEPVSGQPPAGSDPDPRTDPAAGMGTGFPVPPLYGVVEAQWLRAQVQAAVVGTQLILAGPETDVLAARADALAGGMVAAEILLLSRPDPVRRVYCPHCRTITRTVQGPGDRVDCCGCGRGLQIVGHFSRALTAYLGVAAGLEPPPGRKGKR